MQVLRNAQGFALVTTLGVLTVMLAMLSSYYIMNSIEIATDKSSSNSNTGFYAAEAGLNMRAEAIRQTFLGYNRPSGTSPTSTDPCQGSNQGSGDFQCITYMLGGRQVITYVEEDAGNPVPVTIPPGELFQGLKAQEYRYSTYSIAENVKKQPEAILELRFKSRLVPLFQFAAFYNKDLEILPGPPMTLAGPVHTNGDLYVDSGDAAGLDILGQVTTAGDLYRGRKNDNTCKGNPVRVIDPINLRELPSCSGRTKISQSALTPWNGMIYTDVDVVTVPDTGSFEPQPGRLYWDNADLRVVLNLDAGGVIEVRRADNTMDVAATAGLTACGAINSTNNSFYNNREGTGIRMLEVDMQALLNCIAIDPSTLFGVVGKDLDDTTHGGLVFYFTILGPDADVINNYGVRLRNGSQLQSTIPGIPLVQGLTVVTNQAAYVQGDYNAVNKIPAAILSDSFNVLSNAWNDANSTLSLNNRIPTDTTINAAVLSGTDTTGGVEGPGGQGGAYNGGLENYPRFHEKWTGRTFTYLGSFVSLNQPLHVNGAWVYGGMQYTAPIRNWGYDADFNDAANLPPLTPEFVYLRQELFVRQFER